MTLDIAQPGGRLRAWAALARQAFGKDAVAGRGIGAGNRRARTRLWARAEGRSQVGQAAGEAPTRETMMRRSELGGTRSTTKPVGARGRICRDNEAAVNVKPFTLRVPQPLLSLPPSSNLRMSRDSKRIDNLGIPDC